MRRHSQCKDAIVTGGKTRAPRSARGLQQGRRTCATARLAQVSKGRRQAPSARRVRREYVQPLAPPAYPPQFESTAPPHQSAQPSRCASELRYMQSPRTMQLRLLRLLLAAHRVQPPAMYDAGATTGAKHQSVASAGDNEVDHDSLPFDEKVHCLIVFNASAHLFSSSSNDTPDAL